MNSLSSNSEDDIEFSIIPQDVQLLILEKLKYREYAAFNQCSVYTDDFCNNSHVSTLFDFDVDRDFSFKEKCFHGIYTRGLARFTVKPEMNERLVFHKFLLLQDLTTEDCEHLIEKIKENRIKILGALEVRVIQCGSELFERLLKVANVQRLILSHGVDAKYANLELIPKMKTMLIKRGGNIKDNDMLNFKASHLEIWGASEITTMGLIKYLKQWVDGKRKFDYLFLNVLKPLDENVLRAVLSSNISISREATMKIFRYGPSGETEKLSVEISQNVSITRIGYCPDYAFRCHCSHC